MHTTRTRTAAALLAAPLVVSVSNLSQAAIATDDTFEQDSETGTLIGPIGPAAGDIILPDGRSIFINGTGSILIDAGSRLRGDALGNGGTNLISLDGAGSTLELGDEFNLGRGVGSDGTLSLSNGALITIGGGSETGFGGSGLTIGQEDGVGTATINNAQFILDRNADNGEVRLTVGRGGTGTLLIENGSTVRVQDASGVLGFLGDGVTVAEAQPGQNAVGLLTVDGVGTTLSLETADLGALVVGVSANGVDSADGTVNVTNGAVVNITGTGFNSGINVARGGNSTGLIRVEGAGSAINVLGPQGVIGVAVDFGGEIGDGTGTFQVVDQAVVNVQGQTPLNGFFGVGAGTGTGLLEVTTGGTVNVDGLMPISAPTANNNSQSGTVNVTAGGIVNANRVDIGNRGSIIVSGAGSEYNVGDELRFAHEIGGSGSLTVSDGALLNIGGGSDRGLLGAGLNLGDAGTTTGLVDNATVLIDRNADNGEARLSVGRGGNATLTIQNGATVTVQDASGVAGFRGDGIGVGEAFSGRDATGTLTIDGAGTVVNVTSADSAFLAAGLSATGVETANGTVDVLNGGVLSITGTGADAFLNLARGGNSQGTLTIDGAGSEVNVQGTRAFVAVALEAFGEIGDGDGLLTVTNGGVLNIAGATANQGFLIAGDTTGNGVVEINNGGIVNVDGGVIISQGDTTLQSTSQTGRVTVSGTGVLNAEAIGVGERGVLNGDGTISADRLFVFTGGQAELLDLSGYSLLNVFGGELDTPNAFDLGSIGNQTLTINAGGVFSATGAGQFNAGSDISVRDSGSLFTITDAATIATSVTVSGGGRFEAPGGITAGAGAVLSGTGGTYAAAAVTIDSGAVLAPGDAAGSATGSLTILGNLNLNGGQLLLDIAGNQAGQFDVVNVTGDVALNDGSVGVSVLNGFNPGGQRFDVLTATGAYSQDAGVSFTSLGAGPDFEYQTRTEGGLTIGSINFLAFDIGGLTSLSTNQRTLAVHLDALCPQVESLASPTANQLDLDLRCGGIRNGANSNAQVATALDALSPDELFGTYQRLLNFTTIQHGNLARRLNGLRSGAARVDLRNFNLESDNARIGGDELQAAIEELLGEHLDRWGFFSDGRINFGDRDAASTIPGFDFTTASLTFGTDYRLRDNLIIGAALGYNQVEADFDAGGGVDVETVSLSFLGSYFRGSSFYLDAMASIGWSDVDSERRIRYADALGTIDRKASGSTDGTQVTAGIGTGFDFSRGRWVFGPHLGLNYANSIIDAYEERGAAGLDLALPETGVRSFTLNGGLHASYTTTPSWGVLVPYARLDYVREFQDEQDRVAPRFANDPFADVPDALAPFRVTTAGADSDYYVWSLGVHAQFIRGFAAFADYRSFAGLEDMSFGEITVGFRYETNL
ncbi:MAG: autotransporter domain-containing protein [Pseudomonadota bacterium]